MSDGHFGNRLLELRKERGLSQSELAGELRAMFPEGRFSQSSISAMELNPYAPRGVIVQQLEAYFGSTFPLSAAGNANSRRCPMCGQALIHVQVIQDYDMFGDNQPCGNGLVCAKCMTVFVRTSPLTPDDDKEPTP